MEQSGRFSGGSKCKSAAICLVNCFAQCPDTGRPWMLLCCVLQTADWLEHSDSCSWRGMLGLREELGGFSQECFGPFAFIKSWFLGDSEHSAPTGPRAAQPSIKSDVCVREVVCCGAVQ